MTARPLALPLVLVLSAALASGNALAQDEPPPGVPVGLPPPPGAAPLRQAPAGPQGPTTMFSPIMVGIGSSLVVGGVVSVVTGSVLFWLHGRDPLEMAASAARGPDLAAIISGGILVLIGVPLIAIGAQPVSAGPPPPMAKLLPKVGGSGLVWRF